eukprot:1785828-Pleurochrysis_carterae.AAC.1
MLGAFGETLELVRQRLALDPFAQRFIADQAASANTGELRVLHDRFVVSGQGVSEIEGSKPLDAAQREEGVSIVGGSASGDRCALGLAVRKLHVVE